MFETVLWSIENKNLYKYLSIFSDTEQLGKKNSDKDYKLCNKNNFHILNNHLCGASQIRQVSMVAPLHEWLTSVFGSVFVSFFFFFWFFEGVVFFIYFSYDPGLDWCTLCICWLTILLNWWICNCYTEFFELIPCYIWMLVFQIKFSTQSNIDFLCWRYFCPTLYISQINGWKG